MDEKADTPDKVELVKYLQQEEKYIKKY